MSARASWLFAVFTATSLGSCASEPSVISDSLLIENVTLVSPERTQPLPAASVLIHDGRIVEVGTAPSERPGQAATTIDGEGLYLTPGLIDGHTHVDEIPGMIPRHEEAFPEIARQAREQIPRSYLFHGFTTVVDLNARPETIATWNNRELRPRAYFCGAAPVVDGYPTVWLPKPERYEIVPYFLFDPDRAAGFPEGFDPEAHAPEAVVGRIEADGGICVKTHFERGFGGRGDMPVPTLALVRRLVEAAHANGMPVLLHANNQEAQKFGVDAGVDILAHGMWNWEDRTTTDLGPAARAVLDSIVATEIGWQPTIQVLYGERDLFDPEFLSQPALFDVLPRELIDWYSTEEGGWWKERLGRAPFIEALLERGAWDSIDAEPITRVRAALGYLAENEARLLFGSDTPSDPTYANPPGLNGRLEMDNWIDAGVSPAQLFRATTIRNAKAFGLEEEIGSVEPGKRADLLLLRENPLESVEAFDSIEIVIVGGRVLDRADLSARATEASGESTE